MLANDFRDFSQWSAGSKAFDIQKHQGIKEKQKDAAPHS